jgi:CheY-like chemotaxis protein
LTETPVRPGALVVDDDDVMRASLSLYAGAAGLRPVTACDGREALDALDGGLRPAVIVTDVDMPRVDGLELLARVRASATLRATPVVVFSGRREPAPGAEADAWLHKSEAPALIGTLRALTGL